MKPAPFVYHDPRSLEELCALLGRIDEAKLLAGGQSLGAMLNMRYVMPEHLVDLNGIAELDFLRAADDRLEIGAMTRQRALERSADVRRLCPILGEALAHVGHFQTRNRGTIGGSLAHLDPAAELPGIAALYDATLTVAGPRGSRELPIHAWGQGYMTPDLAPDEVLTRIALPLWREPHGYAFIEFARRRGDFAIAGVACLLALDKAGNTKRAAIALIGVAYAPLRLAAAERLLAGKPPDDAAIAAAAAEVDGIDVIDDAHVTAAYRKRLAGVLVKRALKLAAVRAQALKT